MDYARTKHLREAHAISQLSSSCFTAMGIDVVPPKARGGNRLKALNQLESRWIYELQATTSPGLNDSLDMAAFI